MIRLKLETFEVMDRHLGPGALNSMTFDLAYAAPVLDAAPATEAIHSDVAAPNAYTP
jgi:hypothetical protein